MDNQKTPSERISGTVKFYNRDNDYGFILADNNQEFFFFVYPISLSPLMVLSHLIPKLLSFQNLLKIQKRKAMLPIFYLWPVKSITALPLLLMLYHRLVLIVVLEKAVILGG